MYMQKVQHDSRKIWHCSTGVQIVSCTLSGDSELSESILFYVFQLMLGLQENHSPFFWYLQRVFEGLTATLFKTWLWKMTFWKTNGISLVHKINFYHCSAGKSILVAPLTSKAGGKQNWFPMCLMPIDTIQQSDNLHPQSTVLTINSVLIAGS